MPVVLRHLSQLDLLPCHRLNGYTVLNRRHLWPSVSVFDVGDDLSGHHADRINRYQQKYNADQRKRREKGFICTFGAMHKVDWVN
jgi:hypothetical protein